jgi:CBS domain-containing protein
MIRLVKQHAPIIGDQLAEMLGLSRPTIRADLSLLVMLGYLDAKPKVGYFVGDASKANHLIPQKMLGLKVKDVQSISVNIYETTSIHDAVVTLFLEDVGSLTVTDPEGHLLGILSRKDLLKVALGNTQASMLPVSMVMTRQPNVITSYPEENVIEAASKMIRHQIDTLPVVIQSSKQESALEVVGRVTKTTMTQVLISLVLEPDELGGSTDERIP